MTETSSQWQAKSYVRRSAMRKESSERKMLMWTASLLQVGPWPKHVIYARFGKIFPGYITIHQMFLSQGRNKSNFWRYIFNNREEFFFEPCIWNGCSNVVYLQLQPQLQQPPSKPQQLISPQSLQTQTQACYQAFFRVGWKCQKREETTTSEWI